MRSLRAVPVLALAALAGCKTPNATEGNVVERARDDCRSTFAQCAPRVNYPSDLAVEDLDVRNLVQITWRLDLPDKLCAKAGKRLRRLAEQADVATVREIAQAAEAAEATLGRCRCAGDRFRPEYEKQQIAEIVAGRLPRAELQNPAYWSARIDPHVAKLRDLSRRSATLQATGDEAGRAALEADARTEERDLCEDVHAARDVLSPEGLAEMKASVFKARAAASGDASVEVARRALERAGRQGSCADLERVPAAE
jgi:hypothetical protein